MKLNWFSPLPPALTGIADYSAMLLPSLASAAQVTLWTDEDVWNRRLEKYARVRRNDLEFLWKDANEADASIFHIGNNPVFHTSIWQASRAHSGVVVLHDQCLQDLFYGGLAKNGGGEYVDLMERCYGSEGRAAAHRVLAGTQRLRSMAQQFPLWEAALENALGVVVHTPGAFDTIGPGCPCSLVYLPLPYAAADPTRFDKWNALRRRPPRPPFKVVVAGFLGDNRRIESLLQAFAELPLKDRFHLDFYGSMSDEKRVRTQIKAHNLDRIVSINGYIPSLDDAIADADLAINLRYPTMGEASLSQLQIWDHALPSIVTRTGWYATLPEDAVLFVGIEREVEDLKKHLMAFAAEPEAFARFGENGRKLLLREHSPAQYVRNLLQFSRDAASYRPEVAILKTARRAGSNLDHWMIPAAVSQVANRVAAQLCRFLPPQI